MKRMHAVLIVEQNVRMALDMPILPTCFDHGLVCTRPAAGPGGGRWVELQSGCGAAREWDLDKAYS